MAFGISVSKSCKNKAINLIDVELNSSVDKWYHSEVDGFYILPVSLMSPFPFT